MKYKQSQSAFSGLIRLHLISLDGRHVVTVRSMAVLVLQVAALINRIHHRRILVYKNS
jgi:hypothetical protein